MIANPFLWLAGAIVEAAKAAVTGVRCAKDVDGPRILRFDSSVARNLDEVAQWNGERFVTVGHLVGSVLTSGDNESSHYGKRFSIVRSDKRNKQLTEKKDADNVDTVSADEITEEQIRAADAAAFDAAYRTMAERALDAAALASMERRVKDAQLHFPKPWEVRVYKKKQLGARKTLMQSWIVLAPTAAEAEALFREREHLVEGSELLKTVDRITVTPIVDLIIGYQHSFS